MKSDPKSFAVSGDRGELTAFRLATHLGTDDRSPAALPFTWPIRWLARPEIRAALTALVPEGDLVPFHESQTFDYAAPLDAGIGYTLDVAARRETGPPQRLVVEATIARDGVKQAIMETVLRLFSTSGRP